MSDHSWTNVGNFFDAELMGPLPNVVIEGTRVEGWQTVFELLRSDGWAHEYSEDDQVPALPTASEVFALWTERPSSLEGAAFTGARLNFWPREPECRAGGTGSSGVDAVPVLLMTCGEFVWTTPAQIVVSRVEEPHGFLQTALERRHEPLDSQQNLTSDGQPVERLPLAGHAGILARTGLLTN